MTMSTSDERAAVLALTKATRDRPWHHTARAIAMAGSALRLLDGEPSELDALDALDDDDKAHVAAIRGRLQHGDVAWARDLIAAMRSHGHRLITVLDDAYPGNMFWTNDYQPFLWTHGHPAFTDDRSVAIVGEDDRDHAAAVARAVAEAGLTVVAPLRTRLDAAVHESAIAAGGRTVGVLDGGMGERTTGGRYASVARRVVEHGALVSQFWPDTVSTERTVALTCIVTCGLAAITYVVDGRSGGFSSPHVTNSLKTGKPVFVPQRLHQEQPWVAQAGFRGGITVVQDIDDFCKPAVNLVDMSSQPTMF
ncbi:hypothetical protein DP939_37865 [Spongiactinospora rosea]|uniref:Smf/DprA SLOG domain-containing protein n=1 Tax=Spongiactinospora rosea TaxID=2248750 RepID=A0A366LMB6_9ACTN|nr:DNA-processing protein DprA [Spongiactinospora rosea]RBQ14957.1 hypothetical protein DP939_37865 [Spongiactinospora rosea]